MMEVKALQITLELAQDAVNKLIVKQTHTDTHTHTHREDERALMSRVVI